MKGSLQRQLLISMALLIAVPLLTITIVGNLLYERGIDEQATDFSREMLEEVHTNIDSYVNRVDQVIGYLAQDADVIRFLRLKDAYDAGRIEAETLARRHMRSFSVLNEHLIGGLLIAGENGLYVSNDLYRVAREPLSRDAWYQAAVASGGARVLISRPIGRNIRSYHSFSLNDIVSVVRAIRDPANGKLLGVVCADMLTGGIEEHIRDIKLGKNGYVFVQDSAGEIVYAPVNKTVYRVEASATPVVQTIDGERYQLLLAHSDVTGWDTVGVFRMGETIEAVEALRRYTLLLALAAVLVGFVVSRRFSASFTRPISELGRLMGEAEGGNLSVSFDVQGSSGEIARLGQSFNSMIGKIRELLALVVREQKEKRRAEFRSLQAQIKPHFLYNTLDTIRWMAEEREAPEIAKTVSALTRLFRISLSRGREIITLAEETEHVRSYLYIQKVRYEDKLHYEIDVPTALGVFMVPKLILQPLAENAIYHGIKQKRGPGHLRIEAQKQGDVLRFTVSDDGAGMTAEACERLNRDLASGEIRPQSGYGVFNVNNRIRLSYGREYGLHYRINEAGGVTVVMTCPAVQDDGGAQPDEERGEIE